MKLHKKYKLTKEEIQVHRVDDQAEEVRNMMEEFKAFLAGSPYRMSEDQVEGWAYQVAVILPSVLREWYDPNFSTDRLWIEKGDYYGAARQKLAAMGPFKKHCSEAQDMLQALKMLTVFFEDETRKANRGKTKRKAKPNGAPGGRPLPGIEVLEEGEIKEMHISKHERNPNLRKACIEYWRAQKGGKVLCAACGMSYGERYGAFGEGYIEVHHLSPISQTEGTHTVDPKVDLVPLCANCHAMIHRLMTAEKKATGSELEGVAALEKLKECLNV